MKISATIITLDEADNIAECIASAQRVCDEVLVVVDTRTKDETAHLAEGAGARVFHQVYLGDGPQKAFAVPQAKYDWILSLDADERLDEDAVKAITRLDLSRDDIDGYALRRRNFVGDHWIRAAGFYPDKVVRLYHRKRAAYRLKKSHSSVDAKCVVVLNAHLIHFTYCDYTHWMARINELSSRDAWAMYERGDKPSRFAPLAHALFALVRKLIFKGGILQGMDGMTVTMTTVFRTYMKYMKLNEMHEQNSLKR